MPRFELRMLGSTQVVQSDGTPAELPLGKPLPALCFLALEASAGRGSDLAQMLWSPSSEERYR